MSQVPNEVIELGRRLSNWGRWGADDEIGTLNHITAESRVAAAASIRTGAVFSLAIPLDGRGPQNGLRPNPIHCMMATGSDDVPSIAFESGARFTDDLMTLYLQSSTQWDALAHVYYDDQLYNGFSARSVDSRGAHKDGIDKTCSKYVGRGILLDAARWREVDRIPPNERLTGSDLDAIARSQGVELRSGDIILLRTGLMSTWVENGNWSEFHKPQGGLHYTAAEWLHDHQIAAIAADNTAVEAQVPIVIDAKGHSTSPERLWFHMIVQRDMGMCLGELWFLEELATDCAAAGTYDCFLSAPALRVTGGVGSPLNPVALR
ncbi:MAG: cyclase family protein [Ilumatobacteraceae bacterium]